MVFVSLLYEYIKSGVLLTIIDKAMPNNQINCPRAACSACILKILISFSPIEIKAKELNEFNNITTVCEDQLTLPMAGC